MSEAVNQEQSPKYHMVLFVADHETNSREARTNIQGICRNHLGPVCEIEVVDVLNDYRKALEHRVLITPTLLVLSPAPPVRIVGNLADSSRVLAAMQIPSRD